MHYKRLLGPIANGFDSNENGIRAWATINGDRPAGAQIIAQVGVSSITDLGTGETAITWQSAFFATDYIVAGLGKSTAGTGDGAVCLSNSASPTSTSVRVATLSTNEDFIDLPVFHIVAIGRI